MDYGIAIPSYIDAWREVQAAEEAGFTHAWFFDSQLIYSDVYATMALAAQNTSRIRLGTLVAIPTNRIAPVTASAIATINKLAPGRVILAMGTGYTGRNTMGLPQMSVDRLKEYTRQVRGLLRGGAGALDPAGPCGPRWFYQYQRPDSHLSCGERSEGAGGCWRTCRWLGDNAAGKEQPRGRFRRDRRCGDAGRPRHGEAIHRGADLRLRAAGWRVAHV